MALSNNPTDLGSLLASVLTQKDWQRRLRLHQLFLFWDEVVGREIARHAQPQVIKGDVLWLAVTDSIWMQQLQFERHHILELLNTRLAAGGDPTVVTTKTGAAEAPRLADIKFTLDSTFGRRRQVRPKKPVLQEIDPDQFAQFSASLNSIDDQATRESMKRLWLVMHKRPRQ
jgi:hypothetical protein